MSEILTQVTSILAMYRESTSPTRIETRSPAAGASVFTHSWASSRASASPDAPGKRR